MYKIIFNFKAAQDLKKLETVALEAHQNSFSKVRQELNVLEKEYIENRGKVP